MPELYSQLILLLIIAAIGYLARRLGLYSHEAQKQSAALILNIALPASVIAASRMDMHSEELVRLGGVAAFSLLYYTLGFLLIYHGVRRLPRLDGDGRVIAIAAVTFPNIAFMGFPLITALLGSEALFYAAIMTLFFNTALFTAGIKLFRGGAMRPREILLRPANLAMLVMLLLFGLQIKLPLPLHKALDMLGGLPTPLSMLLIGAMIADSSLTGLLRDPRCWLISLLRLLVIPLVVLGLLSLTGLEPFVIWLCVILSTMPTASLVAIMAEEYGREPRLASYAVVHTMLLFIPALLLIMQLLTRFVPLN